MSTNVLESMIAQAEQDARNRAAQALAAEEAERNRQVASARAKMEEALAPELWRALGIDLAELTMHNGAPTVAGDFELGGHALVAIADTGERRDTIRLCIILAARDVCGRVLHREELAETQIYPWESHRDISAERVAEALRAAIALAPDARLKMAERVQKAIDVKITGATYRQIGYSHIDRSRARAVKDEIAHAAPFLYAEQRASLRRLLYHFAKSARRDLIEDRAKRNREAARAAALAAITDAARQYAPIFAHYEQDARAWAQEATSRAWANKPAELWTVRYGRVISETDDNGEIYRTAPEEIVTPDAGKITNPLVQNLRYHAVTRVQYDGSASRIIIANVIDLTPYQYGEITFTGAMAYCRTYSAQPAGVYVNVPFGSEYYPPAPPALSETWPEFCHRTTGHNPPQIWRAYLANDGQASRADLDIPF